MTVKRWLAGFRKSESGAAMVEFTIAAFFFFVLVGGIVDFSYLFFQWNSAAKALQQGVRLASVSDPVAQRLNTLNGTEDGAVPGTKTYPDFKFVCQGTGADTGTCTCTGSSDVCDNGNVYNAAAMTTIVNGRDQVCGTVSAAGGPGMCDIFNRIGTQNVIITYEYTGLGFVGRPGVGGHSGGAVPTITIELTGLTYDMTFIGSMLNFSAIVLPRLVTTATGEDLATAAN